MVNRHKKLNDHIEKLVNLLFLEKFNNVMAKTDDRFPKEVYRNTSNLLKEVIAEDLEKGEEKAWQSKSKSI